MPEKPLCIILARGGSKRFPQKNTALLAGKPLLAYAVETAKESGVFDSIYVSSEDPEILRLAKEVGADHAVKRPDELAIDSAQMKDVCAHLLRQLASEGTHYDSFGLMIPISPLRTAEDIRTAYKMLTEEDCNSVMSVVKSEHAPQQCVKIQGGMIKPYLGIDAMRVRSQELDPLYRHNGAIIFAKTESFLRELSWYGSKVIPYVMPAERSVDIDTPLDLLWAEFLLEQQNKVPSSL